MSRSFVVDVGDLLQQQGAQTRVTLVGRLANVELSSARIPDDADVQLDAVMEAQGLTVVVQGTAYAPWVGECRRCLSSTSGELRAELREVFEPEPVEGETFPLEGERIDLAPMLREVLALALPLAPLCQEDCAGPDPEAHPVDGRVEDADDDESADRDPRWAALDQLRFDR